MPTLPQTRLHWGMSLNKHGSYRETEGHFQPLLVCRMKQQGPQHYNPLTGTWLHLPYQHFNSSSDQRNNFHRQLLLGRNQDGQKPDCKGLPAIPCSDSSHAC